MYEKVRKIGEGSFGEVYEGIDVDIGNPVAIKIIDLEQATEEVEDIQKEIRFMSQLSTPYVVQYHTSFMRDTSLWIIMEYMDGGSVQDLLKSVPLPIAEDAISTIIKSLVRGLAYIHSENKLHRDIKAGNLLLSRDGDVKLADFGVAGQLTQTLKCRNTFVGSPYWMAPEVIKESGYDQSADIWSLGITAYEIATGLPPYADLHPMKALFLIPKGDLPEIDSSFSKAFKDFVDCCLKTNPAERPTAKQLLEHPFLKHSKNTPTLKNLIAKSIRNRAEAANAPVENESQDEGAGGPSVAWDFGSVKRKPSGFDASGESPNGGKASSRNEAASGSSHQRGESVDSDECVPIGAEDLDGVPNLIISSPAASEFFVDLIGAALDDLDKISDLVTRTVEKFEETFRQMESERPGFSKLFIQKLVSSIAKAKEERDNGLLARIASSASRTDVEMLEKRFSCEVERKIRSSVDVERQVRSERLP